MELFWIKKSEMMLALRENFLPLEINVRNKMS